MWGDRTGRTFLALLLWIVFGFVAWNVAFDQGIRVAAQQYLWQEYDNRMHGRPGLRIDDVMGPAARASAVRATVIGGGIAAAGVVLVWIASRRLE
jgi:hypothetical protein